MSLEKRASLLLLVAVVAPLLHAQNRYRLTLQDAIRRGLQANVGVLVAETRVAESMGTAERRQSQLLPKVRVETPVAVQTRSLAAAGITAPGIPEVVGPFTTYDARMSAEQSIVDLQALHSLRAARLSTTAVKSDYQDARDLVIRNVAALYLQAQSAEALQVAAQSRIQTAEALSKLATDQRDAGVATGIDVLRAQVQLANERQSLVRARNAFKSSLLALARNIGMSPGTEIEIAEALEVKELPPVNVEGVMPTALAGRPDYQSLARQREAVAEQLRASRSRYLPKVGASANYGGIGTNDSSMRGTGLAQVTLLFQVFDRDRDGEAKEIEARLQRIDRQMHDLQLGIEQDVRQALLNLDSAAEEVSVAAAGLDLAQKELDLAKLRFSEGVTNNIEVINAQDSLARAQQNSIVAITRHADARISLARALGNTEASYTDYIGGR